MYFAQRYFLPCMPSPGFGAFVPLSEFSSMSVLV